MGVETVPTEISDPVNARILAVSEDRISGFVNEPFAQIAFSAELSEEVGIEDGKAGRVRAPMSSVNDFRPQAEQSG